MDGSFFLGTSLAAQAVYPDITQVNEGAADSPWFVQWYDYVGSEPEHMRGTLVQPDGAVKPFGVAVCTNPGSRCFSVAYTRVHNALSFSVRATRFCSGLVAKAYGLGTGVVEVGHDRWCRYLPFHLKSVAAGQPAVLMIGSERDDFDLTKQGMPGSYLYVGGGVKEYYTRTSSSGTATIQLPATKGTRFYVQWMFEDPKLSTKVARATTAALDVRLE